MIMLATAKMNPINFRMEKVSLNSRNPIKADKQTTPILLIGNKVEESQLNLIFKTFNAWIQKYKEP